MPESRYSRQILLPQLGKAGQVKLAESRLALVGLGALGSACADILVRAGVGYVRLIDDDHVSLSNLQRCSLYDEADVAAGRPKVLAAANHLRAINATTEIESSVERVTGSNALALLANVDLILDGSDNFELRFLLNEAANKLDIPWIYTGVLGVLGTLMPVVSEGPCLRCLLPATPPEGSYPTCNTEGVLGSTTRSAANAEATLALKMLLGKTEVTDFNPQAHTATLLQMDVWEATINAITVEKNPACPVCAQHVYELLEH